MSELQQILGTDKRNPCFTVCRQSETNELLLFFGAELLERLPDDRDHVQYKLLVAQLYNARVNSRCLKETFGVDFKTMRRWGRALESGDADELVRVLAGRQAIRKFSLEIQAFVRMRFPHIYRDNRRSYSKVMREEINQVFGVNLSAETLRPFLGRLKNRTPSGEELDDLKREIFCDRSDSKEGNNKALGQSCIEIIDVSSEERVQSNRKSSPLLLEEEQVASTRFVHHLGVLLFSRVLQQVAEVGTSGWLLKQWLFTLLLGAVNIEQSKLLDFIGMNRLMGRTLKSRHPQRMHLAELSNTSVADQLYAINACLVGVEQCNDFYYDPHTKLYTGSIKILKGWCGSRHFADKALHMDFIHTAAGQPIYAAYEDNYDDLRGRYATVISSMRTAVQIPPDRELTIVFDRGIFGMSTFEQIIKEPCLKVVTWEKNYQQGHWNEALPGSHFIMQRPRNRANDLKIYRFEYQEEPWGKNDSMRLIRVRATNPNGRTVELGILSDQLNRPAEDLIRLMFRRWLQENDFKYMEKHFGINQITSYATLSYASLKEDVVDRQIKSGEYKALEKQRRHLRTQLKQELLKEHQHPGKSLKRINRIHQLTEEDKTNTEQLATTEREASRLDTLINEDYQKLDTSAKKVYDALKFVARNAFYNALAPFKETYDNYRDDHILFRNLTHAPGLLIEKGLSVEAILYPTAHHPPARRKLIEELLDQINLQGHTMPDGSGRTTTFKLGEKEGMVLATKLAS